MGIIQWLFGPHFFDVGAVLCIGIGVAMALSTDPKDLSGAQWFFGIAALLALGRAAHWLVTETSPPLPKPLLAAILFGSIGTLWMLAHSWVQGKYPLPAVTSATTEHPSVPIPSSHRQQEDLSKPVLVFKDSPLFTAKTQTDIRREIVHFYRFLESLQVEISNEPIFVAVDDKPISSWRVEGSTNGEFYKNVLAVPKDGLNDPKVITDRYSRYVFWRLAQKDNRWHPDPHQFSGDPSTWSTPVESTEAMFRFALSGHVAQDLSQSYWDNPVTKPVDLCQHGPYDTFSPLPFYLWEIQRKFGKDFANRVAVYSVIAGAKNPMTDKTTTFMRFAGDRIVIGSSGLDNESSFDHEGPKQKEIRQILWQCSDYWQAGGIKNLDTR